MPVFKGFMILIRRNAPFSAVYLAVFILIFLLSTDAQSSSASSFTVQAVPVGVVDRDASELSEGLARYLGTVHDVTVLEDDKAAVQEMMLYRDIVFLVTVPEGFGKDAGAGITVSSVADTVTAMQIERMIGAYVSGAQAMLAGGFSEGETVTALLDTAAETGDVLLSGAQGGRDRESYSAMFGELPYLIISINCFSLGTITMAFNEPDMLRRMRASAIGERRRNAEFLLGYLLFGLAVWAVFSAIPVAVYPDALQDPALGLYLINGFVLMLMSLSLTSLLGLFIRRSQILTPVVNVLGLGMSFLCGVFVPLDALSDKLLAFSRFLPVYWYESNIQLLSSASALAGNTLQKLLEGYGMQLLFGVLFLLVTMILSRSRAQE